jgi:multicomponent Na+:H+ antiporter subunit E
MAGMEALLPWHVKASAGLRRLALCLVLWVALIGSAPQDLIAGLPAAVAAAWVSLLLMPPTASGVAWGALMRFVLTVPWRSLVAGIDVAVRALDPRMPLRCGNVAFATRLPPGAARDMFAAAMSLQPGTLPIGTAPDGRMLVHCLDTGQPVAAQLAAEETRFLRILAREGSSA